MASPPAGRQPRRSPDRSDPSRPSGAAPDGADETRLLPAEQARIDEAVVAVGRDRGPGTMLVAALVVGAFLLGLVRPWDWLAAGPATGRPPGEGVAGVAGGSAPAGGTGNGTGTGADPGTQGSGVDGSTGGSAAPAPYQAPTCGYPTSWRTAAVSFWAGRRARIWTAAEAVPAAGPDDPAIPFEPIASDTVEAIGWCAPVSGPERPPLAAIGTLFRIRDGVATEVAVDRLEPAARDALGELWLPVAQSVGRRPPWTPGRYVVRLATPSGTYARYLGLEVGAGTGAAGPSPSEVPASATPAPASPSP